MQASWTNWHASSLTMCFKLSIHRLHEDLVVVNTLHHWYSELMRLLWRLTWLSRVDVRGSRGKMVLWRCESFGLFQEDKQVWNKWEKKIKGQLVHPRSPAAWKTFSKTVCVCVCVLQILLLLLRNNIRSSTRGQSNLTKSASRGPIPRLGVTPGGWKLYHWIPGVGFPISVP